MQKPIQIAILDLYNGQANEGMRCIVEIIEHYSKSYQIPIQFKVFDVRFKNEIPDLSFDHYISTGGPGSPVDSVNDEWESKYFNLINQIHAFNEQDHDTKKCVFLICHSFQIYCRYYQLAEVTKRKSTSFGVFPLERTKDGMNEPIFENLGSHIWAVDSRDWQVIQPNKEKIESMGGKILCIEKKRPHVPLERAVMAIRFNPYFFGTQFHPEADPIGMLVYLKKEEKKNLIIKHHGKEKYFETIDKLDDKDKIILTYQVILPAFLSKAIEINQMELVHD